MACNRVTFTFTFYLSLKSLSGENYLLSYSLDLQERNEMGMIQNRQSLCSNRMISYVM